MKIRKWVSCLAWIIAVCASMAPLQAEEIKINQQWDFQVDNSALEQLGIDGLISDPTTWELFWQQLQPQADMPAVDFDKSIVLLHVRDAADPNQFRFRVIHRPETHSPTTENDQAAQAPAAVKADQASGTFELVGMSTRKGFQPSQQSRVTLLEIPREGLDALQVYDRKQKKSVQLPINSTRLVVEIEVPAEVATFNNGTLRLNLFEFDPRLADASATLIQAIDRPGFEHQTGAPTQLRLSIGSHHRWNPERSYYVTLFVESDGSRTHIGELNGERGLASVLQGAEAPHAIKLVLRKLR